MKQKIIKIAPLVFTAIIMIAGGFWLWYTYFVPVWEKKVDTEQVLKIGVITDTQVHPNRVRRENKSDDAPRFLNKKQRSALDAFVAQMKKFQPDVIVFPGDIIEGTGDADIVGMQGLALVKEILDEVDVPILWVMGNHELRSVTREQYKEGLGIDYLSDLFDFGDYRIVVVDSNFNPDDTPVTPEGDSHIRGHASQDELAKLAEALKTDKHTIVTMHHPPLAGDNIAGEGRMKQILDNSAQVRAVLQEHNAQVAFGGHLEVKHHEAEQTNQHILAQILQMGNPTEYFSFPGTKKSKAFLGSFYEVEVNNDNVDVMMFYKDTETGEYVSGNFADIEVEYSGKDE